MAAVLEDVVRAIEENTRVLQILVDIMRESVGGDGGARPSRASSASIALAAGGSSAGGSASETDFKNQSASTASQGSTAAQQSQNASLGASRATALSFIANASDPLTPTATAGISGAEQLLGIIAGAVGGQKAGDAAQALAQSAFNQGGGKEAKFVLNNTLGDLQSTIESMSAQGLKISDNDLDNLSKSFQERNKFRFEQLSRGADAIDRTAGGALTSARDQAAEQNRLLKQIADNTSKNRTSGGATPALRGGE